MLRLCGPTRRLRPCCGLRPCCQQLARIAARRMSAASMEALRDQRVLEIVLVRHGESEGNIAYRRSVDGDDSLYAGKFLERHSSLWRLTDKGKQQARAAGEYIRENVGEKFDAYYTSEYLRAMETAGLMGLDGARWFTETHCRERDWGSWDLTPRTSKSLTEEARRKRHGLYFAPAGGESLAQVLVRVDSMLLFLHRRLAGRRVLMVVHGELMWAFRLRFERLNQIAYRKMASELSEHERIRNGAVLRYSREEPGTGKISSDFRWFQLATPWHDDPKYSQPAWRSLDVDAAKYSNEQLLAMVERFPRYYASSASEPTLPTNYNARQLTPSVAAAGASSATTAATLSQVVSQEPAPSTESSRPADCPDSNCDACD